MNEHENRTRPEEDSRGLPVIDSRKARQRPRSTGLVLDLSALETLDVATLALLLTTRQYARAQGREVWLAGVPLEVWRNLHTMGLDGVFKPFPVSDEAVD